ncbi:pyridoxamine 5'-phosphate oxidase family protein [Cytobacillus purgationiresistens]|uniref:General stress protein 26 n=1 Tax=Cytobacillus purgationiresistens TaxID=863449 RepID=A0ABU0ALB1_9BACI|nr:pyridoxamine 5'-phosphate oxidase family protein [Cytobacillus purgationiresistens]MDQ0272051.1 general stress protein 26 [Cytobacillus purgationiresistens]
MHETEIISRVTKIVSNHKIGVLSTVENNQPHSRYMTFFLQDLTLFTPTKKDTEKLAEIQKNPYVSILLGFAEKGSNDEYIELKGVCTLNETKEIKKKFWNDSFNSWFEGPNDPNYIFLEIKPETIRILNGEHMSTKEYKL